MPLFFIGLTCVCAIIVFRALIKGKDAGMWVVLENIAAGGALVSGGAIPF